MTTSPNPSSGPLGTDGRFHGHVVLVTGSSSGIGAATAQQFAAAGATVIVNSASSVDAGRALAAELADATYIQADVSDGADCSRMIAEIVGAHGRLDVLVNNAGTTAVICHGDLEAATPDVWRRIFDVNVIGTWQVTVAAVPHLRASGRGRWSTCRPWPAPARGQLHPLRLLQGGGQPHDPTAGQHPRTRRAGQRGHPGTGRHPWTEDWTVVREFVRAQAPMQRAATPEDVAEVILGLARSSYVTGEVVLVDGGLNLR